MLELANKNIRKAIIISIYTFKKLSRKKENIKTQIKLEDENYSM